jgi:hypothetical protein
MQNILKKIGDDVHENLYNIFSGICTPKPNVESDKDFDIEDIVMVCDIYPTENES